MSEPNPMAETPNAPRPSKPTARPSAAARRATGQLSGVQIMFAVILAVGLLLAINFSSRIAAGQSLFTAYDLINVEIKQLSTEQAALLAERDYVQGDAYIEQWAHDRGKMIRPGERLVIPVPAGVVATSIPPPVTDGEQFDDGIRKPQPWELWWALFSDASPPVLSNP
ncbi:MAG: septum formation initiator family protein [Armatimonadetes bacterium]|nr:septum formation initiator family protein [Anaerolineae bacterium]